MFGPAFHVPHAQAPRRPPCHGHGHGHAQTLLENSVGLDKTSRVVGVVIPRSASASPHVGRAGDAIALQLPCSPIPGRNAIGIKYGVVRPSEVLLEVMDLAGRRIATLEEGWRPGGTYLAKSSTRTVGPGVYFVRARVGEATATQRVVVMQ